MSRLSVAERQRYDQALRLKEPMTFVLDPDTRLSAEEYLGLKRSLPPLHDPVPAGEARVSKGEGRAPGSGFSIAQLAELRNRTGAIVGQASLDERLREMHWALSRGALSKKPFKHAMHIAVKLLRQGTWSRPRGMPPNWVIALSVAGKHHPMVAARRP
jgi:hypothetical protein